jgi:D-serine dehydratase
VTFEGVSYDAEAFGDYLAELRKQPVRFANAASLFELTFPAMVLRAGALESNVATMAAWCRSHGVKLAPHGKTSMSPEVTYRQLSAGAWGITAATIDQVRTFVEMGVRRVLMANQLVDPAGIAWLASALAADPALTVIGYVDSVAGVALLDRSLAAGGLSRRLPVLVEIGVRGKRTGVRTLAEGAEVARAAAATETLAVVGCSAFEGVFGPRNEETLAAVASLCSSVRQLGLELAGAGVIAGEPILTAGGSTYFDVVASSLSAGPEPATVVLRSGGYVTHDDGLYSVETPLPSDLHAAIDVWAYVLSRPEPGRALIGAGRRDVPFDVALPIVRSASSVAGEQRDVSGVEVVSLNDQHGFLDLPESSDLAVGDRVCLGIAHPCTAFDKWRLVPIVSDDGKILEIAHTLF